MPWKCLNPKCGREFPLAARISEERKPAPQHQGFLPDGTVTRIVIDRYCCPFCESIEFKEIEKIS